MGRDSLNLFLDDYRKPSDVTWVELPEGPWRIVRSYEEFVEYIVTHGVPSFVAYDHDLDFSHYGVDVTEEVEVDDGDLVKRFEITGAPTGYHCAVWLKTYCQTRGLEHPPYLVHSMNPWGKKRIENILK